MSKYLDRLKSEQQHPGELQKVQKAPSCSFCSTERRHITEKTPPTMQELSRLIGETLSEIDAAGDWTGWQESLTPRERQQLGGIKAKIDRLCLAQDRPGLLVALAEYRNLCLYSRANVRG
jgi:hypothetical protein